MAGKEKSYAVCGSAATGVIKNNSKTKAYRMSEK